MRALAEPDGRRAIEIALRRIKQEALASNVMELITCGALPPYRGVLGGKLVALLMLSRQVVADVEQRYGDRVSIIASAMAGRPVRRPAKLAMVTTSSLYEAYGSSQYNRLKVETDKGALAYRKVARTESFGTVQFAPDTVHALNEVARHSDSNRREVNNLFGEGTSPKMRLIRTGLEALGLDADSFLRHNSRRIIYAVPLCANTDDVVLRMSTEPALPAAARATEGTAVLVDVLARSVALRPYHPARCAGGGARRGVRGLPALPRDGPADVGLGWRRCQRSAGGPGRHRDRRFRIGALSGEQGRPHLHRAAVPQH